MKKIYFMILLAGALLCLPWSAKAETLTVMDDDYLNQYVPVDGYNMDGTQHNQFLLLTDELSAMNGGNITGMKFYFDRSYEWSNTSKIPDVSIKFAEIDATSLSSLVSVDESFTEVYSGTVNFAFDTKEWSITFDNGYTYNGGNLLIDIQTTAKGAYVKKSGSYSMRFYTKQIEGRVMRSSSTSSNFPKTTFTYEEAAVVGGCNKPKNVAISEELPDGATFAWTQNLDETTYQWACVAKDAEVETWNTLAADVRTMTVTGLTAGTAYDFYVRSYCGEGENEQSDAVKLNFTPVCPAPAYPATPATDLTATTATVTWIAVDGITQYQYVCVEKDATPDWSAATTTTETSASLTGLTASNNYDFHVRSYYSANAISAAVKTTFKTACGAEALPFSEDFSSSIDCWTTQSIASGTGISSGAFMFSYNSNPPQYLISPELTASAKEVKVTFDYRAHSASYPETFQVGYSTTTNDVENAFTWGDVVTSTNTTAEKYEQVLPAGVKYIAIKYTADDQWALYIDNFSVAEYEAPACEMPTGLAASEITANSAKIAWTSEATAWKLQTSTDGDNWTDVEGEITNPYTLNALTENTKYYVRVCANCGANGDSEWTAAINVTTECAVKSLPLDTVKFESGMPACWSAASQWAVYTYEGHSSSSSMRFNASTTADLTLPVIALNDKAQLTFWRKSSFVSCSVYVNDGEGETNLGDFAKSSDWTETTVDLSAYAGKTVTIIIRGNYYGSNKYLYIDDVTVNYAPVAAVTNVEVTPADGKATVAWECAEEGVSFNLRHKASAAEEWTIVSGVTNPYVLGGLTNGTEYEVQVQAVASANRQSAWTESATFTPINCPAVQSVTFGAATYNSVVVNWTANAAGTWSLRYQAGDNEWSEPVEVTENTYTLTNLEVGVPYNVQVKASCASDEAYVSAAAPFIPAYSAPASATVADVTDVTATLSWDAVVDAPDGYKYIVVARGAEVDWASATATDALTAELSGLSGLTDYDFYVAALYGEHLGTPVKAEFATIAYAPKNLTAGDITTATATFTWEANGAATQYQWSTDGENWSAPATDLTATVNGLKAATTYTFYVRSYYAEDKFSAATTQTFTTECATMAIGWSENFGSEKPNCWTIANWGTSANSWSLASDFAKTGNALRYNARTISSSDAITPAVEIAEKCALTFYIKNSVGNNAAKVECKVLVNDGTTTTEIADITTRYTAATLQTLDLSAFVGKTVNIIFRGVGYDTSGSPYLWIDDVAINYLPVAAPTELAVEPGDQQATISWTNIEEDATYNLRHKATAAEEWTIVNGVTNPYVLGSLTNGTEYEVQVQAVASANRVSEWTESAIFTPVACASIETVTFGDKTYNSVVVNWTATAAGKWDVRYKAEGEADYTVAGTNLTDQTITLNDLKTNVAYTIEVKAACSEAWTAAETLTLHYSSPTNITASNIEDVTATLSWDAVADAPNGYKYIVVARGAEVDWTNAEATDALTAELSGLSGLTDYDFYVAALYGENLGTPTKAEFATIAYAPANLTAGDITTTTATFTWEANGAATQYQWSTDGEIWSAPATDLTATVNGLKAATTYTFYVRSYYAEGKYSEPVTQAFTTACDTYTLPFEENFENAGLPNCWESEDWSENVAAGKWSIDNSYSHSSFTALRFNANTANSASISTPEIALGQKAELSFFLRNVYGNNFGYVEGKVIAADVENEENKVEADFIQSNAENLSEQKLDLSELLGKTVKITFEATGVSANASLYIDDVKVTVKPDDDPTAIGNTSAVKQVIKTIENDQMVIIIDGVKYNAQGQKL